MANCQQECQEFSVWKEWSLKQMRMSHLDFHMQENGLISDHIQEFTQNESIPKHKD